MKKTTIALLTVLGIATPSFAGTEVSSRGSKEVQQQVAPTCFKDQELSLDVFGTYNDAIRNGSGHYFSDRSGGGVGVNFFFARYFGFGGEGNWSPNGPNGAVTHQVTGNFILRYPTQIAGFCVAPYVFVGGSEVFDGKQTSALDTGAGAELRITPTIGLFADWRYNWMNQNRGNVDTARGGIRFVF